MKRAAWSFLLAPLLGLMGTGECPQPDCPPEDGLLKAGTWGGEHWRFDVGSDGTVFVETDCARGASTEPVRVEAGEVAFKAEMTSVAGDPQYPENDPIPFVATFTGTVCHDTLAFTETVVETPEDPTGETTTERVVVYGEPAVLWTCQ